MTASIGYDAVACGLLYWIHPCAMLIRYDQYIHTIHTIDRYDGYARIPNLFVAVLLGTILFFLCSLFDHRHSKTSVLKTCRARESGNGKRDIKCKMQECDKGM